MACSTSDGEALNANGKAVALTFAQGAIDKLENKVGSKYGPRCAATRGARGVYVTPATAH